MNDNGRSSSTNLVEYGMEDGDGHYKEKITIKSKKTGSSSQDEIITITDNDDGSWSWRLTTEDAKPIPCSKTEEEAQRLTPEENSYINSVINSESFKTFDMSTKLPRPCSASADHGQDFDLTLIHPHQEQFSQPEVQSCGNDEEKDEEIRAYEKLQYALADLTNFTCKLAYLKEMDIIDELIGYDSTREGVLELQDLSPTQIDVNPIINPDNEHNSPGNTELNDFQQFAEQMPLESEVQLVNDFVFTGAVEQLPELDIDLLSFC